MKNKKLDLNKIAGGSAQNDFDTKLNNFTSKKGNITADETLQFSESIKNLSKEQEEEKKYKM